MNSANDIPDWQGTGSKARLLQIYKEFEPNARAILQIVDESQLKVWKLLDMENMPTFVNDRLALVGDAAHPFLPHQGQGGGQAMEDAAALGALLPLGTLPEEVPERLQLYDMCRYERAHKIQEVRLAISICSHPTDTAIPCSKHSDFQYHKAWACSGE